MDPTLPSAADEHQNVDSGELIPDTASSPTAPPAPRPLSSAPPARPSATQVDASLDGGPSSTVPGVPLGAEVQHTSTMQGTETTLDGPASGPRGVGRPARALRVAALVACALIAVPVVVLGGRRLGAFGSPAAANDSLEATLDEAREAMRRRAWDAPAGHNFKELTDGAVAKWPNSTAVVELRREAAERLVSDALGRKYASDLAEATHLAALALHFDPQHTTAQHLSAELTAAAAPEIAPAPSGSASSGKPHRGKDGRAGDAARTTTASAPHDPHPTPPPTATPKAPATGNGAAGAPPVPGGAVLPPPPAPHPTTPQPTGPWL